MPVHGLARRTAPGRYPPRMRSYMHAACRRCAALDVTGIGTLGSVAPAHIRTIADRGQGVDGRTATRVKAWRRGIPDGRGEDCMTRTPGDKPPPDHKPLTRLTVGGRDPFAHHGYV